MVACYAKIALLVLLFVKDQKKMAKQFLQTKAVRKKIYIEQKRK